MAKFLPGHLVDELLLELHHWHRSGHRLERSYPTVSHREAMAFVERVASVVGDAEHEPTLDMRVEARTVHLSIHTPTHGGITDADIDLARRIDQLPQPELRAIGPGAPLE